MSKKYLKVLTVSLILFLLTTITLAQKENQTLKTAAGSLYVISAKAGGVNYVEGDVSVLKKDETSNRLIKGDSLEVGEKVSTDNRSKAEILLNPGSYARLGANTEFEFISTSLDDLKLKLTRGSAIFEVYASDDFIVSIETAKARFYLIESGVYRVDVLGDGSAKLEVWKGKAQLGNKNATIIKKKRSAVMNETQVLVEKFDKDEEEDSFINWSKERAKDLAKANARLQRKTLQRSLYNSFQTNRWDFNNYGLWAFDASFGGYCFLPFGYGWRSPYGFGFSRNFFSSRPSSSFYYAVQNRTYRNHTTRAQTRRGNRGTNTGNRNTNRGVNRGTNTGNRSNRRIGNQGRRDRSRGMNPGPRRVSPRNISPPSTRVRPATRPVSQPTRRTISPSRVKSTIDN